MNDKLDQSAEAIAPYPVELTPADYIDPVIEVYKKDVDRTLLRENLKLTVEQRIRIAESFHRSIDELRRAGERLRREQDKKDRQ